MKAFQFSLDPALRWRSTQLRVEQETASRAAAHLASLQAELNAKHSELRTASSELALAGSAAFGSWDAYVDRCRRAIRRIEERSKETRKELALQTQRVVVARQKLRVLENLKSGNRAKWEREFDRETEAFAAEVFLARMSRNKRPNAGIR